MNQDLKFILQFGAAGFIIVATTWMLGKILPLLKVNGWPHGESAIATELRNLREDIQEVKNGIGKLRDAHAELHSIFVPRLEYDSRHKEMLERVHRLEEGMKRHHGQ